MRAEKRMAPADKRAEGCGGNSPRLSAAASKAMRALRVPAPGAPPPVLLVLSGLPGSGKSMLAWALAESYPFCVVATDKWVEVSDEGEVETFTIVHRDTPLQPMKAPFAYAVIRLDQADTGLPHILGEVKPEDIKEGMRVKAVFAEDRTGSPLDIVYFKPLGT